MRGGERGAIAAFALAVLGLLSVLTGAWLRLVVAEKTTARLDGDDLQARSLAEAGVERVVAWFAAPESFTAPFTVAWTPSCRDAVVASEVFRRRCVDADGSSSFRAPDSTPEFGGTPEAPAILVEVGDAPLLFRSPTAVPIGAQREDSRSRLELRLFAPRSPDAIATVMSRATVGRSTKVVRAELMEGPWRGVSEAVYTGSLGITGVPFRVHWGGIAVEGTWDASAWLGQIPRRDPSAAIDGHEYATDPGVDRWIAIAASGSIIGPLAGGSDFAAPFDHLRQHVDIPRIGLWSYEALKAYAKRHGRYYATRGTGLLYSDSAASGVSLGSVLAQHSGERRFLFIDTMDGSVPRDDNLDTLDAAVDFAEVDAYVGAHLRIAPGLGHSVVLDAPASPETPTGPPLARGVAVEGVHYRGLLVVAGTLEADTRVRVVGSVAALQGVPDSRMFEVWYDATLRRGYRSGFFPVVVKPGSRRAVTDLPG